MEMPDVMLWLGLGLAYAVVAIGWQRLFLRFIEPFKYHTRPAAEQA